MVELHFNPNMYEKIVPDPASGGFKVTQKAEDDMDYMGLLSTLVSQGLTMWRWKLNSWDHNCVEASFVVG